VRHAVGKGVGLPRTCTGDDQQGRCHATGAEPELDGAPLLCVQVRLRGGSGHDRRGWGG
jgi:hypothetical protein